MTVSTVATGDGAARNPWPWYPVALVAAAIIGRWVSEDAALTSLLRPMAIGAGAALIATAAAVALLGRGRGGLVMGPLLVAALVGSWQQALLAIALVVLMGAIVLLLFRVRKRQPTASAIVGTTNTVSGVLLLVVILGGVLSGAWLNAASGMMPSGSDAAAAEPMGPNIYLVMLDGYPRADVLERLTGFENKPFLSALEERGFEVSGRSRSSYMHTSLTLGSMFAMRAIADESRSALNDSPAFAILRDHGYRITTVETAWEHVRIDRVDEVCGEGLPTELEMHLIRTSVLRPLLNLAAPSFEADVRRSYIQQSFECLEDSIEMPEPHFAFIHVASPHWPILFQRDGSPADPALFTGPMVVPDPTPDRLAGYVEQVEYVNSRVLDALDQIVAADPDAVIIVFSDHGSEFGLAPELSKTDVDERTANLVAARTPGQTCMYGDGPTTVNLVSGLLNAYLGASIAPSPSDLYLSNVAEPTEFTRRANPDATASCS